MKKKEQKKENDRKGKNKIDQEEIEENEEQGHGGKYWRIIGEGWGERFRMRE